MPILIHPHGEPIIDSNPDPRTDPFTDRTQAGRSLATRLRSLDLPRPRVVVALARGGVPVAVEVARALRAPLEVLVVRKIGSPGQPEWAVAAVASCAEGGPARPQAASSGAAGGVVSGLALNEEAVRECRVPSGYIERQAALERAELQRRERLYEARPLSLDPGTTVIVVDDGVATGTTARAALAELRRRGASRLVLAVPVGPPSTVQALLAQARSEGPAAPASPPAPATPESISASISPSP